MTSPLSFDTFKSEAQFVRRSGSRQLYVQHGSSLYRFEAQSRGRLTVSSETALRAVYDGYKLGVPDTFFADLDRDLRAIGAKAS